MKKMLSKHIIAIALFVVALSTTLFQSCGFLDVDDYFNETLKYDSIFSNRRNIERYLWATAAYFPEEGAIFGNNYTPGPLATDEGFSLLSSTFRGMSYALGEISATNTGGMDTWGTMYIIIRKANTILARMNEATDLTGLAKRELLGYVYFMRAYAYYHLAVKYGPVVIIGDEVLDNNESVDYYNKSRATFDESVDYICDELERAAEYMPLSVPVSYFGRPTRGAAYGLIARLRLIQASPLYNGQAAAHAYFGNWTRTLDGKHYISQQYDERKWAVAAAAAKRIIDSEQYSLHWVPRTTDTYPLPPTVPSAAFPDGAGNLDPFRSYADMFTGETVPIRNPEFLWARVSPNVRNYTRYSFSESLQMGGYNCLCVTQKVVDAYRMADGKDIKEASSLYPYDPAATVGSNTTFSGYELRGSVSGMYANREMRFYASIGFSDCFWTANSTSDASRKGKVVSYYTDGNSGKSMTNYNPDYYPITGYVLRKYIHSDDAWAGDNAHVIDYKPFPIIRYAEILLSYAEALNNLTAGHTVELGGQSFSLHRDKNEIARAFNQVRYRAGLPGLTTGELDQATVIQDLIERERMVEFLFEDRRYFDVRRWGKYETTEKEIIMGVNTDAPKNAYYTVVPVNHSKARNRFVDRRLALFPIALDEVRKAPLLDQNPGYQN
jgi:hypothetical protein